MRHPTTSTIASATCKTGHPTVVAFSAAMTWLVGVRQVGATRRVAFNTTPVVACAGPL
ncbi:hypothetical protein [Anaeromyxobacter oryzae]|uniref:Uncharacterized protein n=1 Tax=Anaeromyxobacter oryzae TaxID=2918170 RepID=A0ABN6MVS9_9BACT|nr:hypothetical protein [Anaeromyxobacter oryzae]BDG05072.1 hypothetical protein AMOR_40680 [Anaeromyxobacter oryzae]